MTLSRRSPIVALAIAAFVVCAGAPSASASTQVSSNSCRYSIDNFFRDMNVTATSSASIVPDARYPAPTDVVPGQTLKTAAGTFAVELPDYVARFGYALGVLSAGHNDIPVKVWFAVKGTNTKERTQFAGPIDLTASTDITVDPADDNRFVSATPFVYTTPTLPEMTWTAVGGDVAFSQADGGALPALPVGPGGAMREVIGSTVIHTTLKGGATMFMDCQPGVTTDLTFDFAGTSFAALPAAPFDVEAGPRNYSCLNDLGRQVTGAAASFPPGVDRELDPMQIALSASGFAPAYVTGVPYTLVGASARALISSDTIATLGRFDDGGAPLVDPGTTYPLTLWVTIAAANTVEGVQTVKVDTTYSPQPAVTPITPTSPWDAEEIAVQLPATTWTPTGAGPIRFTSAPPGAAVPIQLTGPETGGPGGPIATTTYDVSPYGSVLLRAGTERNASTLDCAPAAIGIANAAIPWSNRGRLAPPLGSSGRYGIDPNVDTPAFATVQNGSPPPPPDATPPPDASPRPPISRPPAKRPVNAGRVAGQELTLKRGKVKLALRCASRTATCRGTVRVRTAAKLRFGGKRARVLTLVPAARYSVAAGKRKTLALTANKTARTLLQRRERVSVVVVLTQGRAKPVTRRLVLSR